MYVPQHFAETNQDKLIGIIRDYSFGTLVSTRNDNLVVSHIPFLVEQEADNIVLYGHFARANNHHDGIDEQPAMAIFQGPHTYVSPTWYESKQVPTWNYVVVHVHGKIDLITDIDGIHRIVLELSDKFERERENPWIPDYDESMLAAIVGFKLVAQRIVGKYKLGQNKGRADQWGVVKALSQAGGDNQHAMAELMRSTLMGDA